MRCAGIAEYAMRMLTLAGLALAASLVAASAQTSASNYAGGYNGIGAANGMAMILEQNGTQVFGRIVDGKDNVFQIAGQVNGNAVQGSLQNERANANFQLEMRPSGIQFVFIPVGKDKKPILSSAKTYTFARGPVRHHALADYRVPPPQQGDRVDAVLFLENYRSWSDSDAAIAYEGVPAGERSAFRLFDHLQADLMARLCRANANPILIAEISENQQLNCRGLLELMDEADAAGALRQFQDLAEYQRSSVYTIFACDRQLLPASRCVNVGKITSKATMSWRDAGLILTGYIEERRGRAATRAADKAKEEAAALASTPAPSAGVAPVTAEREVAASTVSTAPIPEKRPGAGIAGGKPQPQGATGPATDVVTDTAAALEALSRLKTPRRKPAEAAAVAFAARTGAVSGKPPAPAAYVPLASSRFPYPRQKPLDAQLVSAETAVTASKLSDVTQPEPVAGAERASAEPTVVKLPRKKPRRFVPELVPAPREKPSVAASAG